MKHQHIWDKVLNKDEEVKYEFSVGDRYRYVCMGLGIFFGVFVFFLSWMWGLIAIGIAVWYYGVYAKAANAFAFTDRRVLCHRGFLSTNLTTTEYSKITDVTVVEPILDSWIYKTGSLGINTAGSRGEEIVFAHIERPYEIKKKLDELRDGA